jgi:hypothetical protein
MSEHPAHSFDRLGLGPAFETGETRKSNLLLEAQLLRAQRQDDAAAAKFAAAAEIEDALSEQSLARGLRDKAWLHRFSAPSCWAQAGDFYHALALCQDLLARDDLPPPVRRQVQDYAEKIRLRRVQWYATLDAATAVKRPEP